MSDSETPAGLVRSLRRLLKCAGVCLLTILVSLVVLWTTLAIHYSNLPLQALRTSLAVLFATATVAAYFFLPRRGRTTVGLLVAAAVVLAWWVMIPPSHDRDWAVEVAVLPSATVRGEVVTVHDVRNFDYRSETDFTIRYDDRTYDLRQLEAVDLALCYWDGNRDIAHTIMSFGFAGGKWLALSIETRREKSEGYSTVAGFFKQFELIYVLADERDVLRLRTNHRGEEVYLYPFRLSPGSRVFFENLLRRINELARTPEWYDAVQFNCTTALIPLGEGARREPAECDLRTLFNGYLDEALYERGLLPADETAGLPYEEMRAAHRVTEIAKRYESDPDFSSKIREHLPTRRAAGDRQYVRPTKK